jgi:DNA replication protein DnaC
MRVEGYRNRLTADHFELMRIPRRFWGASVSEIEPLTRKVIVSYLRQLDDMLDRGAGILLWGRNGRGKTSAAVCVAKEARRRGASVLMVTAAALIEAARERSTEDRQLVERVRGVDFLLLDDLDKEYPGDSGYSERFLENLFRERGANRLTTWITSNAGRDGLIERYKISMMEVLKEMVVPVRMRTGIGENGDEGENHRDDEQKKLSDQLLAKVG